MTKVRNEFIEHLNTNYDSIEIKFFLESTIATLVRLHETPWRVKKSKKAEGFMAVDKNGTFVFNHAEYSTVNKIIHLSNVFIQYQEHLFPEQYWKMQKIWKDIKKEVEASKKQKSQRRLKTTVLKQGR